MVLEAKNKAAEENRKSEATEAKAKRKTSPFELLEKFMNEKNINEQIFKEHFFCHTPLFLTKELYNMNRNANDEIVKRINTALIELKQDITRIPKNKFLKLKIQII